MWRALGQERKQGVAAMRPIVDWLEARGLDRQRELNERLCGHISMSAGEVRALLDQGSDPNWVAPNGIPVLEHALLRYWNAEAVDVLAARATPRNALWIAAGLGDVEGVRRFLDREGMPTPAARRLRPDFVAVGGPSVIASLPFADDEEILVETLLVAMLNQRTGVLEYLASRGAPLDSLVYGLPLINIAVGNVFADAVECLVRCGASLDLGGGSSNGTARELARELFEQMPHNPRCRRILMVCGMDPDAVLAERDARPVATPKLDVMLERALRLAREDAAHVGQPEVRPENLLIGLMRAGGPPFYLLKELGRMDVELFHSELADRLSRPEDAARSPDLPMHLEAQAALDAAVGLAAGRRQAGVAGVDLLRALVRKEDGSAGTFLARYGVNAAALNKALETAG
jgi:hypothetical protein